MTIDTARVHLEVLGEAQLFELPIPVGPTRIAELLPAGRKLIQEAADAALRLQGTQASCAAGCGVCCRQLVTLTLAEVGHIAEVIGAMELERRQRVTSRIAAALETLEKANLLGPQGDRRWLCLETPAGTRDELARRYFRLQIPCPFLEAESCSIHPDRPLVCREFLVTSDPAHCATQAPHKVKMVPYLRVTRAVGRAARKLTGALTEGVPLLLVLELIQQVGPIIDQPVDGVSAFRLVLEELGPTQELPDAMG